jgi:hypothetical protein
VVVLSGVEEGLGLCGWVCGLVKTGQGKVFLGLIEVGWLCGTR